MLRNRIIKSLLLTTSLLIASQGCVPRSRAAKTTMVVAGVAAVVAGAMAIRSIREGEDTDGDGIDEFPDGEIACLFLCVFPAMLSLGGAALALYGIASPTEEPGPPTPVVSAAPGDYPNTAPIVGGAAFNRPLPELAADQETISAAKRERRRSPRAPTRVLAQALAPRSRILRREP